MTEQQPDPEGLTDDAISPDDGLGLQPHPEEATDPDLANTAPGDDDETDSDSQVRPE